MASFKFPYDNPQDYAGRIVFRTFDVPVPTIEGGLITIRQAATDIDRLFQQQEGGPDLTPGAGRAGFGTVDTTPDVNDRPLYGPTVDQNKRLYSNVAERVTLYLPQAIVINEGIEYDNVSLGALGGVSEALINRGSNVVGAIKGAVTEAVSGFTDLIVGGTGADQPAARLAAVRLAERIPGETAANVARSTTRVAVNPNRRTLFRAVTIREFSFTFKMIANSPREAQEIENIIQFFRYELYPDLIEGLEIVGYQFPRLFDIRLSYNNVELPGTKINPCYLRNLNVTYNPSSMGWHVDGKPSEVDMTMTFVEERTLSKKDIRPPGRTIAPSNANVPIGPFQIGPQ